MNDHLRSGMYCPKNWHRICPIALASSLFISGIVLIPFFKGKNKNPDNNYLLDVTIEKLARIPKPTRHKEHSKCIE